MATPARTSVIFAAPVRSAMNSTSSAAAMAPVKAATGTSASEPGATAQQSAAARPAPEFTPMVLGAARGLASTLCVSAPLTARAAPARMQPQMRGRRA